MLSWGSVELRLNYIGNLAFILLILTQFTGFFGFLGPNGLFLGMGHMFCQQLLFSFFPSIRTFNFVLIWGLFWIFWTQMGYFFGCDDF